MNRTNEEKLDLFADLLEPVAAIIMDKAWASRWQAGDRIGAIREAIKGHKPQVVEILARIEGVNPAEYTIDGMALFVKVAMMFNRPDLEVDDMASNLFTLQRPNGEGGPSGAATGNTGDGAI